MNLGKIEKANLSDRKNCREFHADIELTFSSLNTVKYVNFMPKILKSRDNYCS